MTNYVANGAKKQQNAYSGERVGELVAVPFSFDVDTALANGDIIALAKLPARHIPVDYIADVPELDTGTDALVYDVGIRENDASYTDVDQNALVAASTKGQAGGLERMGAVAGLSLASSDSERVVALTVTTGPNVGATGVTIKGVFYCRPLAAWE